MGFEIWITSLNIHSGCVGGLEVTLRALWQGNARVGIIQETNITDGINTHYVAGYSVLEKEAESCHHGGIVVLWREEVGWQVEGMSNFGPNLVRFLLTLGERRWYFGGDYVLPNDVPTGHQVDQELTEKPPGIENILMGDLNSKLENPRNEHEETILDDHDLEDACRHFTSRRKFRGRGRRAWQMQQEGRQVMGRGDYVVDMERGDFTNAGMREPRLHTDHRMIIVVIRE